MPGWSWGSRRASWVVGIVVGFVVATLAGPAAAQPTPLQTPGRQQLRDRANKPQATAKLDEAIRKFNSDDPETRLEGIQALGELDGEKKAVDYLLQAVNDPDPRFQIKAIDTLGNMKAKDATPLLIQQLFLRDTSSVTKQRLLAALGKIGDSRATPSMVDFLSRDVDPALQGSAIFALGEVGDRSAVTPLETYERKEEDENLRRLATEAIRKIRERPAPTVVPPALADDRRGDRPQTP